MISPNLYREVIRPSIARLAATFGGVCFHSCGNWSRMIPLVLGFPGLRVIDGAFTARTDPCPNPAAPFADALPGSGIVLNARMAGSVESVVDTAAALWRPGSRLIVVTYCATPAAQEVVCRRLRALAEAPPPVRPS